VDEVLRIQRDDVDAHKVNLALRGHIVADWADLLERECVELSRSGLSVTLEFSGVVFIGRSPLIADMLEQEGIVATRKFGNAENR